jgi:hypothetical protein
VAKFEGDGWLCGRWMPMLREMGGYVEGDGWRS